ncbi:MAG TPA: 5-(carboxyamino)imidazole ribonucleotide synthase [Gemmatimonadales bacterium]|nr:5-(carboxyamino)imidazole ribonucleotide synthase [Gemmatimonadales bacterium]
MILPGSTLGLLGGGQLGRMFTQAAQRLGYEVVVLDPDPLSPAGRIAAVHIQAGYTDEPALTELGKRVRAVTTEFENVPASSLAFLRLMVPVRPGAEAVSLTQDRIAEKIFAREQGLMTAPFHAVLTEADLVPAIETIGAPAILKTSRLGYDGKGQASVEDLASLTAAFDQFGRQACILERRLPLDLEISVVLTRAEDGQVVTFPVGENRHVNGILDTTVVPARIPASLAERARQAASKLARAMHYVGTMAVEFFVVDGDQLLVNELAPRPHNSGHYTLDACVTDQFEQQVRALVELPLGDTTLHTPCAMVNLLGDLWIHGEPRWDRALSDPAVKLHLYGKKEPRVGRKMGHLTALGAGPADALTAALAARARLTMSSSH